MLGIIIVVFLVLLLVGAMPTYNYSRRWGYAPGGVISLVLVIVIVLVLMGRI